MIATANDVRAVRGVAMNISPEAIEPYIDDVEKQDIIPAIGADLYFAIEDDRNNEKYSDFLFGGKFMDCSDCVQYSRGLIVAIAYLSYARMVDFNGIQVTAFGVVKKESQYSKNASDSEVCRASDGAKKIGLAVLGDCVKHAKALFGDPDCCAKPQTRRHDRFVAIKCEKL